MSSRNLALKNAVTQILSCALQPHSNIQRLTEERKKALEMTDEYPFILMEIIRSQDEAFAEKLMAATFLKNFIHDMVAAKEMIFSDSSTRCKIAMILLDLLTHESKVIGEMISYSLEWLVASEYPALFPAVNNKIMSLLLSEDLLDVRGALLFMNGFLENHKALAEETGYFTPEYIEPLLNILQNENQVISLRSSTVPCLVGIFLCCSKTPDMFATMSSRLGEIFNKILIEPYSVTSDFYLKKEIVIQLTYVIASTDEAMTLVIGCLPAIGQLMFNCCMECKEIMMGHRTVPRDAQELGEPRNFPALLQSILLLINDIMMLPSYASLLASSLDEFIYFLFILMGAYANAESTLFDEDSVEQNPEIDLTIRGRCAYVLMVFMDKSEYNELNSTLHSVIQRHISEIDTERNNCDMYFVKILESLMYGVGLFTYVFEDPNVQLLCYIEQWSTVFLNHQCNWLILARLLWVGSKYSTILSQTTLHCHLRMILSTHSTANHPLRIACLDALRNHLILTQKHPNKMVFSEFDREITDCIFSIAIQNPKLAKVCLQSTTYFFEFTTHITEIKAQRVYHIFVDCLVTHIADMRVLKYVKLLLSKMSAKQQFQDVIKNHAIPFVFKLIYNNCPHPLSLRLDLPERGFDLLNTIVLHCPNSLENGLVTQAFFAAYNVITQFEDSGAMEIATILMSNLLMKASYQIHNLRDYKGKLLTSFVPMVLFKLLEPYPQETLCPSKFGRLCVISIMTIPACMEPMIEPFLKALLSALQRTENVVEVKSYCFILAYMFTWQTENITKFLSGIPGPDGGSALAYFLNRWNLDMIKYSMRFEQNIMTIALCNMIEYSTTKNDNRINNCRIRLDEYNDQCGGLEKLFLCLALLFLHQKVREDYMDDDERWNDDLLVKNHPICDLNIYEHIKGFLVNYTNSIYYFNAVKKYVDKFEDNIDELEKNGIKPNNL